ncbi:MAG: MarR family transcriptional regulator, partial [Rhodospirillales bacterium]|nr:MarR family transcriptional regulator [Rhodospirillales bacterium]
IAELVLHLGKTASSDGFANGMTPAHWAVLRYFSQANRFSRKPSAFAAFHGTTRGTASQIIKILVADGYLDRVRSETDRRSVRLDLTDKARAALHKDPLKVLAEAADALPAGVRGHFSGGLQRMLRHITSETDKTLFGTCRTCIYLVDGDCGREEASRYECGFVNDSLLEQELSQLCVNFNPDEPTRHKASSNGNARA